MPTYCILKEDEFIISLTKPAEQLVLEKGKRISVKVRNPHHGREDELAYEILTALLRDILKRRTHEPAGDQG